MLVAQTRGASCACHPLWAPVVPLCGPETAWGQEGSEVCLDVRRLGLPRSPVALQPKWEKIFFLHLGAEQICYREV